MITTLAFILVLAVLAGIFLRSALHALALVAFVLGIFMLSCYAFRIDPRAALSDTAAGVSGAAHAARHGYRAHRRELRELL